MEFDVKKIILISRTRESREAGRFTKGEGEQRRVVEMGRFAGFKILVFFSINTIFTPYLSEITFGSLKRRNSLAPRLSHAH